jgi:hypothetical protein
MKVIAVCGRLGTGKDTVSDMVSLETSMASAALASPLKSFAAKIFRVEDANFYGASERRSIPFVKPIDRGWLHASAEWMEQSELWHEQIQHMFDGRVTAKQAADQLIEGLSPALPITTPRVLLQYIGTEWGRALWDEVWLYAVKRLVQMDPETPLVFVIPDCRFPNEAAYLKRELNAHIVWVDAAKRVPIPDGPRHSSEPDREALAPYIDRDLDNNGTLNELRVQVRRMLSELQV